MNNLTARDFLRLLKKRGIDCEFQGDENVCINGVASIDAISDGKVIFYRGLDFSQYFEFVTPRNIFIVRVDINRAQLPIGNYIFTKTPEVAFYHVASCFKPKQARHIHPNALVSANATIGRNVSIGAFTYIGPNVIIEDDVSIDQCCVVDNAQISKGTVIQTGVKIGSDALGVLKDESGKWHDRPHFGSVIIGTNVRIEDNAVIQRGYLRNTIIYSNVRIGPCSWIGNGVTVGQGSLLAQAVTVAGSATLGANVSVWGNASVREGVTLGDNCVVGMGAVVLANIPTSEVWVGNPAKFLRAVPALKKHNEDH